ncbi:hypothetical protein PC9H_002919 [Pleurotus ostreatus]|uniref:Uncharacterized protein n=1 Tax=Pleurotus ostreatus TaxID=5322 RepID=A0A8H6ZXE2_PLEOS|nr:uncharacterized protein PC9H_002919 [Pleurotus ostreatus]KAF7436093.1 hypothetical protein PC9H_002919 [Pleurotus ostreatus]
MPASSCTCKLEHVCAALTTTTHAVHTVHHHHHYHHYDEREEGREAPSSRAAKIYANHLAPPITTSFFHKQTINVFDNYQIQDGSRILETLTWRTDVYKYVTRARPDDPNFKQNGGEIYIIMAHEGTCLMGRPLILPAYLKTVKVPSSIMPVRQFPANDSGIQSGDDWSYNIDYANTMPMFNQGGNNVFDFEASFKEDFVRSKCKQIGEETSDGLVFGVVEPRAISINYPVKGLSVFKCLDPTIFPVNITFEASVRDGGNVLGSISKEVTIPFDFFPVF